MFRAIFHDGSPVWRQGWGLTLAQLSLAVLEGGHQSLNLWCNARAVATAATVLTHERIHGHIKQE